MVGKKNQNGGCLWGKTTDWKERGLREACGLMGTVYILQGVPVMYVYTLVLPRRLLCLTPVSFTVRRFYIKRKKPENNDMPPEVFRRKRRMSATYFQTPRKIRWINR